MHKFQAMLLNEGNGFILVTRKLWHKFQHYLSIAS
uniref:Uncharacterized protein n=1 Tax=Anguilla anguilla TaxID=7936 RepID=A0A0E9PFM1_ANGAN